MKRALPCVALVLVCGCSSESSTNPVPTPPPTDAAAEDASSDLSTDSSTDVSDTTPPEASVPETSDSAEAAPPACGTGAKELPPGLVELKHDDGTAKTNLRAQKFQITVNGTDYVLNDQVLHEAVRFDLAHPARVHGFAVQWAAIPEDAGPTTELTAGLYPDFGYNGFDFWVPDPYWTGTRCVQDAKPGDWVTYVFDKPLEVSHPGLVYVAHRAEIGAPVFSFDGTQTGSGTCEKFDECHSSINMPEAETSAFYNGVSFSLQYDYMVRLYVEYTEQLAPEKHLFQAPDFTPKGHVSFGDYNNDGFDDMLTDGPTLYRNKGDGTYEDATAASGLTALGLSASGGVWGDYDNDGCLDLFLFVESYTVADTLLHSNCNGTFSDATPGSGILDEQTYNNCGDPKNTRAPTAAAAFVDLDADGLLDLYLANFICWDKETYYSDNVWHNLGSGKFEDWSGTHGFSTLKTPSRGANPIDHDQDGDMDVFVNNYRLKANLFFDNQGGGLFKEAAKSIGLAGEQTGLAYYGHTIGAAWGDLDNDGDFDIVQANLAHPRFFDISDKTQVLIHNESGTYDDIAGDWAFPASAAGLRYQETHSVPALADFDNDGVLDLVITAVYDGRPTDFYWGKGDGTFQLDSYHAGITTTNGWGVAVADFDNDGSMDVFAHRPFRNTATQSKGHWFQVRVVGNVAANRAAIGATVRVVAGGKTRLRHVQGGSGSGNQDSQYLHFGVADATQVDSIEVAFPGGKKVTYAGPFAADKRVWVYEDGTSKTGVTP